VTIPSRSAKAAGGVRGGEDGMPVTTLCSADGASADIYLQGAHVTSWRPAPGDEERLFLSARSEFRNGAAIRGGVPVIFPQFAAEGPLPRHGFARTSTWSLDTVLEPERGDAIASFILTDSPATRALWTAEFRLTLTVRVGGARLVLGLAVENTGASSFTFTCALHTYIRVNDVARAEVAGLTGTLYRESSAPTRLRVDKAPTLRVTGAMDRVYVNAPRSLTLCESDRAMGVDIVEFPDVVLWNPGAAAARALPDMEPDGERTMLCIEAAAVQQPITLAAGGRWQGAQVLDASRAR
jgi:glucose-6-phosphate 1-epimerase